MMSTNMSGRSLGRGALIASTGLAVLFAHSAANAQMMVCTLGEQGPYTPMANMPPAPRPSMELMRISQVLCPMGCGRVMLFENQTVSNAMTSTMPGQGSVISYNPGFMGQIFSQFGAGATFGVLAHEFGHHIDLQQPAAWMDHAWGRELRADAWAGCALARSGFDAAQASAALQAIAAYPSPTHPAWNLRVPALRQGYMNCGGTLEGLFGGPPRPPRFTPAQRPIGPAMQAGCGQYSSCDACVPVAGCGWCGTPAPPMAVTPETRVIRAGRPAVPTATPPMPAASTTSSLAMIA
jgi:hypothetical protein